MIVRPKGLAAFGLASGFVKWGNLIINRQCRACFVSLVCFNFISALYSKS